MPSWDVLLVISHPRPSAAFAGASPSRPIYHTRRVDDMLQCYSFFGAVYGEILGSVTYL